MVKQLDYTLGSPWHWTDSSILRETEIRYPVYDLF